MREVIEMLGRHATVPTPVVGRRSRSDGREISTDIRKEKR